MKQQVNRNQFLHEIFFEMALPLPTRKLFRTPCGETKINCPEMTQNSLLFPDLKKKSVFP